ncbi:hypothetical protein PT286_10160 [Neisseriaceae bacterium ESL0693]|nr:hypothetical protein [Neisseriaceae bacterium ESL0693]
MGTQMKFQGTKYQEIKLIIFHMETICKANCLKRLSDNQYAIVSLDAIRVNESLSDAKFRRENYYELIQEEFKNSFLEWLPSVEQALDSFLAGFE